MVDHIFVSGFPGPVGGANTECMHTVKLWRKFGLGVTLIPTWRSTEPEKSELEAVGARVLDVGEKDHDRLKAVEDLPGSIVVSFCNSNFLRIVDWYRDLGCKIVWVNCMTWIHNGEIPYYKKHGAFDRYVFQSGYQIKKLTPHLRKWGYKDEHGRLIRGAFSLDEWPFNPRPHSAGEPFIVGRVSRAAEDKWSSNTWPIYGSIPYEPIQAQVMGWSPAVEKKCHAPPKWAMAAPQNAQPPQNFLKQLHCMLQINGGAGENWPRSGLEAMAIGVPCVVQNQWGWTEMIKHGETGYLCNSDRDLAYWPAHLARNEQERMGIALAARTALERNLANPEAIWEGWRELFEGLA